MNGSRRMLPPMAALNSFAAAARHQSFSKAGDEVGLTQSAVSRQVAVLEDWVQASLFDRIGRKVVLNARGQAYAEAVAPALDRIRGATSRLMSKRSSHELSIATLPSFGMRWLAPRLPGLTARHPELIVNFAARSEVFDFALEEFDAAIHFGQPDWPRVTHDLLFQETSVPVCAPAWLKANPVHSARDLLGKPLLSQTARRSSWKRWFREAGLDLPAGTVGSTFEHFLMLAQATAAGAGMALIPEFLIEPERSAGLLISPLDQPLASEGAYYLVYPDGAIQNPVFRDFREWLVAEAARS